MRSTDLFKTFVVVADERSITKAAEKLYISQPALTKAIKELENELGGKLFVRKSKGVELTSEGRHIYERVLPILSELDNIYSYFDNVNKLKTGVLRIGTDTANITLLLNDYLTKFIAKYPNIEIKITRDSEVGLINGLRNNDYDFVMTDREQLKPDMGLVRDFEVKYSVIGGQKFYKKFLNKPLSREGFAVQPLALIEHGHASRANIETYFGNFGINLICKYDLENYGLVMEIIKKGTAIGIANLDYFKGEQERGEIFKINTDFEIDPRTISLIYYKNAASNPAREVFKEMLMKGKK